MSREELERQGLRDAFTALAAVAGDGSRCPEPGRLWGSAREELAGRENEEVLLHLGECTACATAWRLARELSLAEAGESPVAAAADHRLPRLLRRWTPLLAAAVVVVGVGALLVARLPPRAAREPVYRSREGRWLETRVPSGTSLPRGAFVLHWAEGPQGTTYDLHVTTETLTPLALAPGLRQPQHQVEEAELAAVVSGERVLWRVIAHLPDGRAVASRTFVTAVQ